MQQGTSNLPNAEYNSRWFIWTIVFLVVTGISLVSYIVFSDDNGASAAGPIQTKLPEHKVLTPQIIKK